VSIRYSVADHIATITIDRPERRNALDLDALDALADAWARADADDEVRAVILTGAGDVAFSAGADIKHFTDDWSRVEPVHPAFYPELSLRKPLLAAVNGVCLAGGTELLLACDIRVAAEHATFGLPEPQRGLFPAGGSAVRAPRRLGWANAMELLLTGAPIDAARAMQIGLVNRVVPRGEVVPTTRVIAARIAANPPFAVRIIKECALRSDGVPLIEALEQVRAYSLRHAEAPEAQEAVRAFREGRDPDL